MRADPRPGVWLEEELQLSCGDLLVAGDADIEMEPVFCLCAIGGTVGDVCGIERTPSETVRSKRHADHMKKCSLFFFFLAAGANYLSFHT